MVGMVICGIPYALNMFGINLPEPLATMSNKFISGLSVAILWMSKLVIKTPNSTQTLEGVEDDKYRRLMPFTSYNESKENKSKN